MGTFHERRVGYFWIVCWVLTVECSSGLEDSDDLVDDLISGGVLFCYQDSYAYLLNQERESFHCSCWALLSVHNWGLGIWVMMTVTWVF